MTLASALHWSSFYRVPCEESWFGSKMGDAPLKFQQYLQSLHQQPRKLVCRTSRSYAAIWKCSNKVMLQNLNKRSVSHDPGGWGVRAGRGRLSKNESQRREKFIHYRNICQMGGDAEVWPQKTFGGWAETLVVCPDERAEDKPGPSPGGRKRSSELPILNPEKDGVQRSDTNSAEWTSELMER